MTQPKRVYYGWYLIGVTTIFYGLGMGPAYYTWGFVLPEVIEELGLTRTQAGSVFGVFSFVYHMVAPLAAMAVMRWGVRRVVSLAALTGALGFFGVSRANSVMELYLTFGLLGGLGVGFGAILPAQALMTFWFQQYRARAIAFVFTGGGLIAIGINPANHWLLEHSSWRNVFLIIAFISLGVAVFSALFVRNRPQDMGWAPDGEPLTQVDDKPEHAENPSADEGPAKQPAWTARQAILTRQFLIITLCGLAYGAPWNAVVVFGRLHLEAMGHATGFVAFLFSMRLAVNTAGRFAGGAGDFISPTRLLALALFIEALGTLGLTIADSRFMAIACMALLGLGFGAAFVTIPVVFAHYFGAGAFAVTQGTSRMINSIFGYAVPTGIGFAADITGSYSGAFVVITVVTMSGAVGALLCPTPRRTPSAGDG